MISVAPAFGLPPFENRMRPVLNDSFETEEAVEREVAKPA